MIISPPKSRENPLTRIPISRANKISQAVIDQFTRLPPKRKPTVRDNGQYEWIPLSGIVAEHDDTFTCLALATGMKCLAADRLATAAGNVLHDWHAEVLAIRTFNRFLLDECLSLSRDGASASNIIVFASGTSPPFRIRPDVKLHMYSSEAPCGDASMEIVIAAQHDATPWTDPPPTTDSPLPGRGHFSHLGIVRRKPSRADAPPTTSKSCSDKLALKQCTSLLCALTSLFVDPSDAYLETLVLPASQFHPAACERAFSSTGRMASVSAAFWSDGYVFRPFIVEMTTETFCFSREVRAAAASDLSAGLSIVPCNVAAAWSASSVDESIVAGILHGRKSTDPKCASRMSRQQMWAAAATVVDALRSTRQLHPPCKLGIYPSVDEPTYSHIKGSPLLATRSKVKADVRRTALSGWIANQVDSDFGRRTPV
ncbi:tRNA-specific adenosine deaminase [Ophiocordyceps camponoti-floridani]|uniref:tRNA-specific adenosine deaminase n=1 Tax=Ophiocordyceps camponoti-floridani TaxID=2030778 RepID=A0A8H4Q397_9HYPO|nr:tRNA-specific adenosine deaminase [Ophiocordyceps camponoti-floridani]